MSPSALATSAAHPYYPLNLVINGYVANDKSVVFLLTSFVVVASCVIVPTLFTALRINARLTKADVICVVWFILTGSIHTFFEGYFVLNSQRMPSRNDLFGQLWKEYSLSDSRYMSSDSFVVCVETITVVVLGPVSFVTAYLIAAKSPRRHCAQAFICVGHVYSDLLYYATSLFDYYYKDISHCRPEPLYFWLYYFLLNFIWILVPAYLLRQSVRAIMEALELSAVSRKRPQQQFPENYAQRSAKVPSVL